MTRMSLDVDSSPVLHTGLQPGDAVQRPRWLLEAGR